MSTSEISCCEKFTPPPNFSWVVDGKLAAMGWPNSPENLKYLRDIGVSYLVTLSPEKLPPVQYLSEMQWTLIPVEEFDAPTLQQVNEFIDFCKEAHAKKKAVGVHCRQGRGRTGTMSACYLVHFENLAPQRAVINIRLQRPGSVETYRQEKIVEEYWDGLSRKLSG